MKIWTKTEINKGYCVSDKTTFKGVSFELFGLSNFMGKEDINSIDSLLYNYKKGSISKETLINNLKYLITSSKLYNKMITEGYHTHLYLNINSDGVDCFISR